MLEIPGLFHISLSASRVLITPKCVVSGQSGGACFSRSAHGPCCLHDVWFPALWPMPPISAHASPSACCNTGIVFNPYSSAEKTEAERHEGLAQ